MKAINLKLVFFVCFVCSGVPALRAQLSVSPFTTAQALAQKLVGEGITISNVTFTGSTEMAGFFNNLGGTNINIDSGIVLTNGRVAGRPPNTGISGPSSANAHNQMGFPGDPDLSAIVSSITNDACVLEFDFIPLGNEIEFRYVFSSEEYPDYACSQFNDAFAFFIEGPGFPVKTNIALIPNTTDPVTIRNINDQACAPYPQYYINNAGNSFFTHNGHTVVFTALADVTPCETYHLKLVVADVADADFDSGVFLEAGSLTSNAINLGNVLQTDPQGNSYLAEGCTSYSFRVQRPQSEPFPLIVNLSYSGTATNGTDVVLLPASITIPANETFVDVTVVPLQDGIPEGIELLEIAASAGCSSGPPAATIIIQIRDYDILSLTPDSLAVCKNSSVQLTASTGYSVYEWQPDPTLSNTTISNPVATPVNLTTTYICTATESACNARDSVFLELKDLELISKTDVNCRGQETGTINVRGGAEWEAPVEYSLDGNTWQVSGNFSNLQRGTYTVRVRDASGCTDNVTVEVLQAFPDLFIDNAAITPASCSGNPDGQLTVTASGGQAPYAFSLDGTNFQSSPAFNLNQGDYTVTIQDNNGCLATQDVNIALNNTVTIDAGDETSICEGDSFVIPATSNAENFTWTSTGAMTGENTLTPTASPTSTAWYYVTATSGICSGQDAVLINVRPAPIADAGEDFAICFGKEFQLNGSGGVSYEWSPSSELIGSSTIANPVAKARRNITYSLAVTDANGCGSLVNDEITITVTPSVKIFAGRDTIASINQPIQLNVIETGTSGVTRYVWSPAGLLSDPNIHNPVATLPHDQLYTVTGITDEGCEGMDDVLIKVYKGPDIYVPSAFTPNNDGLNDYLKPVPAGITEFRYFRVFNRWGQLIYSTQDPSKGWDGTVKGMKEPPGTYVWMAEGVDYTGKIISRKGTVTIIR